MFYIKNMFYNIIFTMNLNLVKTLDFESDFIMDKKGRFSSQLFIKFNKGFNYK